MAASISEQQEAFAFHLARKGNITQAALAAGYKSTTASGAGSRLAKRPDIAARVEEHRKMLAEERTKALVAIEAPNRERVLQGLLDVLNDARADRDRSAQLRSLELIGKELGMFVTRVDANVNNPLAGLSPEAIIALSRYLAGEVAAPVEGEAVAA